MSDALSIHFFTIVLNGEPFIRYHIDVFRQLSMPWVWHIIEGVASLAHDTAWSIEKGGRIPEHCHRAGWSKDGTTEYLEDLKQAFPDHIRIYRKPPGQFWDGKLEMVQAPLPEIHEEALLWQVDADELWTLDQIQTVHGLFQMEPSRRAAYFWCHFFVGPDLVIASRNNYGNNPAIEWLRVWRFDPRDRWLSHEPPILAGPWARLKAQARKWRRPGASLRQVLKSEDPRVFSHQETEDAGLVFQHLAYVTPEQARFKEDYYGYQGAESAWRELQRCEDPSILLRDYFPWVRDQATVTRASSLGIQPLMDLRTNPGL